MSLLSDTPVRYARKRHDGEITVKGAFILLCLLFVLTLCTIAICWNHGEDVKQRNGGCVPAVVAMDRCSC